MIARWNKGVWKNNHGGTAHEVGPSTVLTIPRPLKLTVGLVTAMAVDGGGHQVLGLPDALRVGARDAGHRPTANCHALHKTPLRIVVVDGVVLGRAIIPHCNC